MCGLPDRVNGAFPLLLLALYLVPLMASALSIDGHANASSGASPSLTTTQTNDIIVVLVANEPGSNTTAPTVSNMSDTSGLFWQKRSATTTLGMKGSGGGNFGVDFEIWWAKATSTLTSDSITPSFSGTTDCDATMAFGVHGANTSNTWDTNISLPDYAQSLTGGTPSVSGVSTSKANTMLFGFLGSGEVGYDGSGTSFPAGSGFSVIDTSAVGNCGFGATAEAEYKNVAATQSNTSASYGISSASGWFMVGDAIVDATQPSVGRVIRLPGHVRLIGGVRLGGTSPIPKVAPYVGPGDIVSYAFWGGFRAYSAATAGTKAVRLVRASDSTQQDINTLSNGQFDAASAASFCTATTCKVVTIYDQTGNNSCAVGTSCDWTQSTDANRPTYTATGGAGGKPCANFAAGNKLVTATADTGNSQPFSLIAVASRTGNTAALNGIFGETSSVSGLYYGASSNAVVLYAGSISGSVTASDNAFHSLEGIFNNASSQIVVDGSSATPSPGPGTGSFNSGTVTIGSNAGNDLVGTVCEVGDINGTLSGAQQTSISSNQHGSNGYNF